MARKACVRNFTLFRVTKGEVVVGPEDKHLEIPVTEHLASPDVQPEVKD